MPKQKQTPGNPASHSDQEIRDYTIGELQPLSSRILIVDYDSEWPELFRHESERVAAALGPQAIRIEHTGSTSVPGLAAKPVIDMLVEVSNSADEPAYAPLLEAAGYVLRIREPHWHEHRMFIARGRSVNLHVFSSGCPEIDRILLFRDWLRTNTADRELYARAKMDLAEKGWKYVQNYADAKTVVIEGILARAALSRSKRRK